MKSIFDMAKKPTRSNVSLDRRNRKKQCSHLVYLSTENEASGMLARCFKRT